MEVEREAGLDPVADGEHDLGDALFKKPVREHVRIGHHAVGQALVLREVADELHYQLNVAAPGGTVCDFGHFVSFLCAEWRMLTFVDTLFAPLAGRGAALVL